MKPTHLALVIPCYTEEEALPISSRRLLELLDQMTADGLISKDSYILCSNDGSRDNTWQVIEGGIWEMKSNLEG